MCGAAAGGLCGFLLSDLAPVEIASLWIPLAAGGALLGCTRLWSAPLVAAALLAAAWGLVAWTPLAATAVQGLPRTDALRPAAAIVVMASRLQRDGEPTAVAHARLSRGVELLAEGLAERLILPELAAPAAPAEPLARAWLARFALEIEVLSVGPVSRTREEAVAVAELCRRRGWRSVILVTSPLHSRRASGALEREGLEVISAPALETRFDIESLDRPPERLRAASEALYEIVASWIYARRGWI